MKHILFFCLSLTLLISCGNSSTPTTMNNDQKVTLAATVAKEIQANPSTATETLKKHNLTQDQFENLLYDIASDPALSQKYQAALKK